MTVSASIRFFFFPYLFTSLSSLSTLFLFSFQIFGSLSRISLLSCLPYTVSSQLRGDKTKDVFQLLCKWFSSPQTFPVFLFWLYLRCLNLYSPSEMFFWGAALRTHRDPIDCQWVCGYRCWSLYHLLFRARYSFYSLHICVAWINVKGCFLSWIQTHRFLLQSVFTKVWGFLFPFH